MEPKAKLVSIRLPQELIERISVLGLEWSKHSDGIKLSFSSIVKHLIEQGLSVSERPDQCQQSSRAPKNRLKS